MNIGYTLTDDQMETLVEKFGLPSGVEAIDDVEPYHWCEMIDKLIDDLV